jgi:Mg-chelatase subunit ChlD
MNVANILPGDDVKVELRYTELLVPQSGNYQFVFPTVVGPRYNSRSLRKRAGEMGGATHAGRGHATQYQLQAQGQHRHADGHQGDSLGHAHHRGEEERRRPARRHRLASDGRPADNRDFVLDYRLAGEKIESGLMLYKGQGQNADGSAENFFLAMVEPPKAVAASAISPRDYIFVVDISGSMHGFPLDTAKTVLERLIGGLRASDTFNVLLFSGSNKMLSPRSVPATRANIEQALATIQNYSGSGSTELIPALKRVYAEPKEDNVSRTVVVVTDGYVTVEREAFELVRNNLSKANVFAFGIGSSVNRSLMEGIARAGMGEPFIITDPVQAPEQAARFRRMVESPVLTSVKATFGGLDVYDVEPQALPDVLGERPVIVFGKWRGEPKGRVIIEGQGASGPYREEVRIDNRTRQDTAALRTLWARHRIQRPERPGNAGRQRRLQGAHHRAGPEVQPAHAVHELHRGRQGGAQPGAAGRRAREPAAAPAARRERAGRAWFGRRSAEHAGARIAGRHCGGAVDAGHAAPPCAPQRRAPLHVLNKNNTGKDEHVLGNTCPPPPAHRGLGHPHRPHAGRRLAGAAVRRAGADLGLDGAAHARRLRRSDGAAGTGRARRAGLEPPARTARLAAAGLARAGRRGHRAGHAAAHGARSCARVAAAGRGAGGRAGAGLRAAGLPAAARGGAAGGGPVGAGAAAAVVAAVLCGLSAARAHGRGQPLAAGAGLRGGARRRHADDRRPPGHRGRALLRRADGVAGLLHGLRGRAVGGPLATGASCAGCRWSACACWPATSCATAC